MEDLFGLNEYMKMVVKEIAGDEDFKDLLFSLTSHMKDKYSISPLPKLKFVNDDKDNAKNILGKTAYYDPNARCITLYTCNRHPKDILRSYAHEMIHHVQNLEDRLHHLNTTNINEDDYLRELEREAYEQGNLSLREWENSLRTKN